MADIFFKKNPGKEFTETTEPLDNTEVPEGKPFPFEQSSVYGPWGWYPFLYESPFTDNKFGPLSSFVFDTDGFDIGWPTLPPFVFPSGELSGDVPLSTADITDAAVTGICDPANTAQLITDFCEASLSTCGFGRFLGDTASLEGAAIISDVFAGGGCGTACQEILDAHEIPNFSNADCDGIKIAGELLVADTGQGAFCAGGTEPISISYSVDKIDDITGVVTNLCNKSPDLGCRSQANLEGDINAYMACLETAFNLAANGCNGAGKGCDLDFSDVQL